MKSSQFLGLFILSFLCFVGCGKSNLANGTAPSQPTDSHGNSVRIDKLRNEQIVGGCTLQLNAAATAAGTSSCVDFVQSSLGDMTKAKVASICSNNRGQSKYVEACPVVNVNALCKLNIQGTTGYVMVYNSNNVSELQKFADNCKKRGGQINP